MLAHCATWPQCPSQNCARTRCSQETRPEISFVGQRAIASFIGCHGSARGASRTTGGGGGATAIACAGGNSGIGTGNGAFSARDRAFGRFATSALLTEGEGSAPRASMPTGTAAPVLAGATVGASARTVEGATLLSVGGCSIWTAVNVSDLPGPNQCPK